MVFLQIFCITSFHSTRAKWPRLQFTSIGSRCTENWSNLQARHRRNLGGNKDGSFGDEFSITAGDQVLRKFGSRRVTGCEDEACPRDMENIQEIERSPGHIPLQRIAEGLPGK